MNSDLLLSTLQQQLSQNGYLDVAALDDASYTTVFDQLGIFHFDQQVKFYTLYLTGNNNQTWQSNTVNNQTIISLDATLAQTTTVLGLPATTPASICFTSDENTPDFFVLTIQLSLAPSWKFGQSFSLLNTALFNSVALLNPYTNPCYLRVTASEDVVNAPEQNSALYFSGYIDPNTSLFTVLTWFISGGISNPVQGPIQYVASTGTVDMELFLSRASIQNVFGKQGTEVDFTLSLYSGLNEFINLYEPGIRFETDLVFGQHQLGLIATYSNTLLSTINLNVTGLDINLIEASENALGDIFGDDNLILNSIPDAVSASDLHISTLQFQMNFSSLQIQSATIIVKAFESTTWDIWPGVFSLSQIAFSFTAFNPTDPANIEYDFSFTAITRFGNPETGIPLLVSANLPGLLLSASLYADSYSLMPLLEYVFDGDTKGLPSDLEIHELTCFADIARQSYSFSLDIVGQWDIYFGQDKKLTFDELEIYLDYSNAIVSGRLKAEFNITTNVFTVGLNLSKADQVLYGSWSNTENPLDYEDIAIAFGMYGLPNLPQGIDLNLTEASFKFETAGPSVSFELTSASYGSAALIAGKDAAGNWGFVFGLVAGLDLAVNLTDIDVVGNFVPEGMDVISVDNLRFVGATSAIPVYTPTPQLLNVFGTQINSGLVLSIDLNIGTLFTETFSVRFGGLDDGTASDTPPIDEESGDENPPTENDSVQLDTTPTKPTIPAALPGPTSAWINVQRSFGPVHIARIGFRITEDNSLGLLLDAGVNLAGLSIGLSGLEADIPISAPFWPSFSLAGLEVGYVAPGITIAGALIKAYGVTPTMYTGELILQAGGFGASAFGSYTTTNNEPSLFAFLALNIPIGGPPFCVVTGLSMGFGYNRRLILPTIETVQTYPLVQAAMGITDPQQTINALNQYIVPADNQYWLAAGIRFTSFEMLNAYAMLTASFGTQVELALMGEALLTLPIAVPGEEELILAQADMVLLASITPSFGQISISAQLTSRSYILDKNAQITGGFAFYFWFGKSAHKGDFIVTLGGYNPYFTTPTYYPKVPLLGLNWQISNLISIKGGLYCALTPSVIMAGGNLSASYASGDVKAWFNANADFLIRFKPFSFDSTIAVSVGASYKLNLLFTTKTVSVTVGASLKLWGPPFAGTATVDLHVMSFTIAFGAAKQPATTSIGWNEFRNSFLPKEPGTLSLQTVSGNESTPTQSLIQFNAERGMISSATADQLGEYGLSLPEGSTSWRMNPGKSRINITTSIPSKTTTLYPSFSNLDSLNGLNVNFGIGPMSLAPTSVGVNLTVTVFYQGVQDATNSWSVKPITENVPSGLWLNTSNSMNGDSLVKNVLQGIQLTPIPTRPDVMASMPLSQLLYFLVPDPRLFNWSPVVPPSSDFFNQSATLIQSSLNSSSVISTRNDVLTVLAAQGLALYSSDEIDMDDYAANTNTILYANPRICYLGETSSAASGTVMI
jgi:hypothetical protein